MIRKAVRMFAIAAVVSGGAMLTASPSFAVPAQPIDLARALPAEVEHVSFWGMAYPYGYAYRAGHCVHHVRHHGRWRRIWVCN